MLVMIFCLILFLWGVSMCCTADDIERKERNDQRRHREFLENERRLQKERERRRRTTRTVARDERGRFIAQETVEEDV